MNTAIGIFMLLHGLVHIWYIVLSQEWVKVEAEMGWTGKSWLLSSWINQNITSASAAIFYGLSAFTFVIASIGLFAKTEWTRPWLMAASILSALTILVFWDGDFFKLIEKGALGFIISVGFLVSITAFKWLNF